MKNFNRVLALLALFLLMFPVSSFAAEFKGGEQASFNSSEKTDQNLYMGGSTVVSAGTANKDLLVAGGTVLVSGPVGGDMFVVGGNISVLGSVAGDARIGGGNISISGNVGGDLVAGAGQLILSGKSIGGDALLAGGTVRMDSAVKGNLKIAGGEIYINGPVEGNVEIKSEKLTLGPSADIKGNLKYEAAKIATIEEGGKVRGQTTFTELKGYEGSKKNIATAMLGFITFMVVAKFFMLLLGALLFGLFFKRYSKELVAKATANPLKEFGRGVVVMIVLPVISIILLTTVIGIPFGIIGLLSVPMLCIFAMMITPIFLGALVYKWVSRGTEYVINWKTILLGVVIYFILSFIPLLGSLAVCASVAITLGASLNIKREILNQWR